jgi:hypothetical protein
MHGTRSERATRADAHASSSSRLLHKAAGENPGGVCCEGRGRQWERRGRGERAVAERSPSPFSTPPLERAQ